MSRSFASSFGLEVAKGTFADTDSEFKFGRNDAVGTTEEVVWDGGGNYTFITAAETVDVVSTNAGDTAVGAGAQTVVIFGLDSSYNEQSETITMNGTTIVTSVNTYIRIFRALVLKSGTNTPIGNANLGTITVTGTTSTTKLAEIKIGNGQTLMSVYTIPASTTGYVTGVSLAVGQGKQCYFRGKFRNGPDSTYAFSVKFALDLYQSSFYGTLVVPLRIPEKTDIVITGQTSSGTVDATASFGIILIDN